jgi:hypothetical protein
LQFNKLCNDWQAVKWAAHFPSPAAADVASPLHSISCYHRVQRGKAIAMVSIAAPPAERQQMRRNNFVIM